MAAEANMLVRHQIDFILYNLPPSTVSINLATTAGAENFMLTSIPMVRVGAAYIENQTQISNLYIRPRRIEMEIDTAPALLPLSLQITSRDPFVYGWLQVPEGVQTSIATAVQRIRIIGPGYWALPLGPGTQEVTMLAPESTARSEPGGKSAMAKSGPAASKVAIEPAT